MDNAEQQSPRGPSRGSFDTASLLVVEEVLGHLYAKPPSAELKTDSQHSGTNDTQQTTCKTTKTASDYQNSTLNSSKVHSPEEDISAEKNEKSPTINNVPPPLLPLTQCHVNSVLTLSSQKAEGSKETNSVSSSKCVNRRKKLPKDSKVMVQTKTDKKVKSMRSRSKPCSEKKPKMVSAKAVSSDSESHIDTSGSSSGCIGVPGESSSPGASSSGSSDSTDEEEREKQQIELRRLKKQQKMLRRKVQELKQASHDSSQQKTEINCKKIAPKVALKQNHTNQNHTKKPIPSPAHSSILNVSPKLSPKPKLNSCTDDDANMPVPLDLCVKKQEPTFEVSSSSSYLSSLTSSVNSTKKQLQPLLLNQDSLTTVSSTAKVPGTATRRRGRKPKYIVSGTIAPEIAHQIKQNNIRDLNNLLLPQKTLPVLSCNARDSDSASKKNSVSVSKSCLLQTNEVSDTLSAPRKTFTLDSLLSESNGTVEFENKLNSALLSPPFLKNSKNKERTRYSNKFKKIEENNQDTERNLKFDSSSATDSDLENDHSDSDESISGSITALGGNKRTYDDDDDGEELSGKRRRVIPDEREIQIPLEHGWRRETKIRCFSRAGVRGEVTYYTPCGKKLRSYPEVVRYLIKNGITDISRDNFTFSTKVNVGDFLEASGEGEDYALLGEQEVIARINEVRSRKGRLGVQNRKSSQQQRTVEQEEQQRQWEQKQLQHQLEQQEFSRRARELKILRQLHKEQALIAARNEKKTKVEEARRQKEQQRLAKQQERFERLEQLRIEREIRAQQALEEMKRQQAAFLREQERERRRQHMLLVRALETRKKQEERERKKEEIMYEKRINKEKKMEQRRIELDYLRELKKPVEDMMLKDNAALPIFNRIPGVKLAGKPFSDLLMVYEFLHNFGETLGFDPESLPNLNTLQMALLNTNDKVEEELLSVIHHLLVCAIEDPGVPHSSESATVLGQNLKDADITNSNVSEVLRLYFTAQNKRSPLCQLLQAKPFLSLNATQKVEILAHLCDDLLGSRVLMRKIDSNIENVNVLRKDKWLIEGDLRRLKTVQQRRLLKEKQLNYEESKQTSQNSDGLPDGDGANGTQKDENGPSDIANSENRDSIMDCDKDDCEKEKMDDLDNDNESGNESDDTQAHGLASDGEDEDLQLTNEELTKKVDKLTKQLSSYSNKLTKALHTIRAVTFGQDRYHRRYWVLPKCGGVYVESIESSELPDHREKILAACVAPEEVTKEFEMETIEVKEEVEETKECANELENKDVQTDVLVDEAMHSDIIKAEEAIESRVKSDTMKNDVDENLSATKEVIVKVESDQSELTEEKPPVSNCSDVPKIEKEEQNILDSENQDNTNSDDTEKDEKMEEDEIQNDESVTNCSIKTETDEIKNEEGLPKVADKDDLDDESVDKKPDVNIFMPKFCNNNNNLGLDNCQSLNHSVHNDNSDRKQTSNPSIPSNQNWLLHSPFFASLLTSNMLFSGPVIPGQETNGTYFNLPKNDSSNPFGPFLGLQHGLISPEQIFKSISEKQNMQKPWFSILPRMPCDEDSLPKSLQNSKNTFSTSVVYSSPTVCSSNSDPSSPSKPVNVSESQSTSPPIVPTTSANRQLSNLQMEILNGAPPGFFLHPFIPHQFGTSYQNNMPSSCSSSSPFTPTVSQSTSVTDFSINLGRPPASSTPTSIPTPTATPGPNSTGCSTPTYRDSPTLSIKRLMIEKMMQEYEHPKPIPSEFQKGWWRITDPSQIKDLINSLHHRGIREKMLQKHLQKHFNYVCGSCSYGMNDNAKLEETEMDKEISELPFGVPSEENSEVWSRDVALRLDMAILEQIENLEEKIDGASMQIKGWKPPAKLSTDNLNKFIPACELYQVKQDVMESPREKSPKKSGKKNTKKRRQEAKKRAMEEAAEAKAEADQEEKTEDISLEVGKDGEEQSKTESDTKDKDTTDSVDGKEFIDEKNSIDEKEKNSIDKDKDEEMDRDDDFLTPPPGKINPVEEAKKRLLMVESAIERRYLKPPLGFSSNDISRSALSSSNSNTSSTDNGDDEVVPLGLTKWRNSVQSCKSSSQLAMCLNYLENYTAWDKSIMRASCQFCHSGENEEMLLLCDGCDKGYHTYCFKPKMDKIPDGDWYCYECLNKATGENVCVVCGKKGKLVDCSSCPKCFHLACLDPPLSKMPKGRWYCSGCTLGRPKKSSKKSSSSNNKDRERDKEVKETVSSKKTENSTQSPKTKSNEKKDKKEKTRNQTAEDLSQCRLLVEEMEKHEDSWPFLSPVNTKQFPTYRKIIKKPMDLATVRGKLEANQYRCRDEFATDVRLIFDNCETFNEDDSPVGQAGHTMRAFFDSRWSELSNT